MKNKPKIHSKVKTFVVQNKVDPFVPMGSTEYGNVEYWNWGSDNLFPVALSNLSRKSTAHRRIINDKADYISGRGFVCDDNNKLLNAAIEKINGNGETLRQVINKIAFDKCLFGNAFVEIVTNPARSFISLFHQDASRCRLSKDRKYILLNSDWSCYNAKHTKRLPIYPAFENMTDGTLRSIIHYKDYEPMFENYGVPPYIAGIGVSSIAYKTDKWNISRLDNSFQLSGVMILDSDIQSEEEAKEVVEAAEKKFAGKPGQVMFMIGNSEGGGSKFIPVTSSNEGDWKDLHEQASTDIVVAHSWFRSLSGLDYSTGFSPERILHEYEVAKNTIITGEQAEILEPIKRILADVGGLESTSLSVVNRPPVQTKPAYMRIWEARRIDGLDYDENDPEQQAFLSKLTSNESTNNT